MMRASSQSMPSGVLRKLAADQRHTKLDELAAIAMAAHGPHYDERTSEELASRCYEDAKAMLAESDRIRKGDEA